MAELTIPIDLDGLVARVRARAGTGRTVIAVAGPPGSGKSTQAEALAAGLNAGAPGMAAVLPMDGYHYDDLHLVPAGLRPRKGAPETFDVAGYRHMLGRLRAGHEDVAVPVFDRELEIARAGARIIPAAVPVIVTEGNYLLLNHAPWDGLAPLFDLTVMIAPAEAVLRERLTRRWQGYGLTPAQISAKLEDNDLPNGRLILAESRPADFLLEQ